MNDYEKLICERNGISPEVYEAFARRANKLWRKGRRRYGAKAIIEVMRYESAISDYGVQFKLNNNDTSKIVRVFQLLNPDHATMFETRTKHYD